MAEKFEYTREWTDAEAFPLLGFSRNWNNQEDYPTVELDEKKVREDMQSLHDEVKTYINTKLIPAVLAEDATENARIAAEDIRVGNENKRVENEDLRVEAERLRAKAETAREDAEDAREAKETGYVAQAEHSASEALISEHNAEVWAEGGQLEGHNGEVVLQGMEVGAKGYAQQAKDAKDSAELHARNARAMAEGGTYETKSGICQEVPGAKNYANQAYVYVEGGTFDDNPFDGTPSTVRSDGAKNLADKAKAFAEGGSYKEWEKNGPSYEWKTKTVEKGAKQYAEEAAKSASDALELAYGEPTEVYSVSIKASVGYGGPSAGSIAENWPVFADEQGRPYLLKVNDNSVIAVVNNGAITGLGVTIQRKTSSMYGVNNTNAYAVSVEFKKAGGLALSATEAAASATSAAASAASAAASASEAAASASSIGNAEQVVTQKAEEASASAASAAASASSVEEWHRELTNHSSSQKKHNFQLISAEYVTGATIRSFAGAIHHSINASPDGNGDTIFFHSYNDSAYQSDLRQAQKLIDDRDLGRIAYVNTTKRPMCYDIASQSYDQPRCDPGYVIDVLEHPYLNIVGNMEPGVVYHVSNISHNSGEIHHYKCNNVLVEAYDHRADRIEQHDGFFDAGQDVEFILRDGKLILLTPSLKSLGASSSRHENNTAIHVTSSQKTTWTNHGNTASIHVTESQKSAWTAKAEKPKRRGVVLPYQAWDSASKSMTIGVNGVVGDETAQLITITPAVASQAAYYAAGIKCTGQATNTLTFTAETIPTVDLTVYAVIQEVAQ